jgi:hypothetical protein
VRRYIGGSEMIAAILTMIAVVLWIGLIFWIVGERGHLLR